MWVYWSGELLAVDMLIAVLLVTLRMSEDVLRRTRRVVRSACGETFLRNRVTGLRISILKQNSCFPMISYHCSETGLLFQRLQYLFI